MSIKSVFAFKNELTVIPEIYFNGNMGGRSGGYGISDGDRNRPVRDILF